MPKKKHKNREYPLYTRKARKLTDIKYLIEYIIARTSEAKLALAALPGLPGDRQWQVMHSALHRQAIGNAEAEHLYQLLNGTEPYSLQAHLGHQQLTTWRIPDSAEVEAARRELAVAGLS